MLDIRNFRPVAVPQGTNEALNIQVIPRYDTISLELDDRINLMFIPLNPIITPKLYFAETGEFLRDITVVRILDSDSECCIHVDIVLISFTLYASSNFNIISTSHTTA